MISSKVKSAKRAAKRFSAGDDPHTKRAARLASPMQSYLLPHEASQTFGIRKKREVVYVKLEKLLFHFLQGTFRHSKPLVPLSFDSPHHQFQGRLECSALRSIEEKDTLLTR
jgi:hypothetical protein